MYLTAQMHRSFASLKMTAYIYVANLPDTTLEGRSSRHDGSRDLARAFAALLAFSRFENVAAFLAPAPLARRAPGTFPILGSPARTSSQARRAACSKSGASAGSTCQPVTFFPNT